MFSRKRVLKAKKRDGGKESSSAAGNLKGVGDTPTSSSFFARILGNARGTASCIDLSKSTTSFSISADPPPPIDDPPMTFLNGEKISVVNLPDVGAGDGAAGAGEKRRSAECRRSETMPGNHELMVSSSASRHSSAFQPIDSSSSSSTGWYGATQYEEAIPASLCQREERDGKNTEPKNKWKSLSTGKPNEDMLSSFVCVGADAGVSTSSASSPSPGESRKSSIKRWNGVSRLRHTPVDVTKKSFSIYHDDSSSIVSSRLTEHGDSCTGAGHEEDLLIRDEFVNALVERSVERIFKSERFKEMVEAIVRRNSERFERRLDEVEKHLSTILDSLLLPTDSPAEVSDRGR